MYKTHTLDEYNRVIELRKKGWNLNKIFSFLSNQGLNISYGAISDWIYTNKKPFQDKILSKINKQEEFLTEEKAYILGVLCGDGYIRIHKSGHYLVGLDVVDEDFADEFRKCLEKTYGLKPSKNFRIQKPTNFSKNPKPRYVINLTSKLVVLDLLKYSRSFKTKEWQVPNEIFNSPIGVKSAFLRGLFDSEGSASFKKTGGVYLSVCSGNEEPLLKLRKMLKDDFDIDLSIVRDRSIIKLKSCGYKNVKNFNDKINFNIKRKSDTLKYGLFTYKRQGIRRYSPEFKRKALELLEKYDDVNFVSNLFGVHNANIYDWKNGRYVGKMFR